jgi:hypothetical protein
MKYGSALRSLELEALDDLTQFIELSNLVRTPGGVNSGSFLHCPDTSIECCEVSISPLP